MMKLFKISLCAVMAFTGLIHADQKDRKSNAADFELLIAIDRGDIEAVKKAIAQGANINERVGQNHEPALMFALECLKNEAYKQRYIRELRLSALKAMGAAVILGGCLYAVHYAWNRMLTQKNPDESQFKQFMNTIQDMRDRDDLLGIGKKTALGFLGAILLASVAEQSVRYGAPHVMRMVKVPHHYWHLLARMCIFDEILMQKNIEKDAIMVALEQVTDWEKDTENNKVLLQHVRHQLEKKLRTFEQPAA